MEEISKENLEYDFANSIITAYFTSIPIFNLDSLAF